VIKAFQPKRGGDMQFRMRLAGVVAASAASAALVAGGTAVASTQASSKTVTGPEVIAGTVHGKAAFAKVPVIPLG
jgi:hypothetical protein